MTYLFAHNSAVWIGFRGNGCPAPLFIRWDGSDGRSGRSPFMKVLCTCWQVSAGWWYRFQLSSCGLSTYGGWASHINFKEGASIKEDWAFRGQIPCASTYQTSVNIPQVKASPRTKARVQVGGTANGCRCSWVLGSYQSTRYSKFQEGKK